ncbi:hypothetical protein Gogos_021838 [Gossypium gossypioides]|uniref:RNase H type-1 domain-containing protein n=1 Tax=Gossypium gossypioides TaxID=34282 RepID=A0A7J9D6N3_GOSGO|nr:hypothetical protein [Gossypium gossypioides]
MNSIWLREEGEGKLGEGWMESRFDGLNEQNEASKGKRGKVIDPILGISLEGRATHEEQQRIWRFTWERGNLPETNIQERLDRGVANTNWIVMFPEIKVQHLAHSFSDHCPLLINTRRFAERVGDNNFRFEAWWLLEESFMEEVKKLWENSSEEILKRLDNLKKGLQIWAGQLKKNRQKTKQMLTKKLGELRRVCSTARCPRCYFGVEESLHVFRECPFTREVWQALNLAWVMENTSQNTWEWLTWVFKNSNNYQCRLFCYALWLIWSFRNKLIHEGKNSTGRGLAQNIQRHMVEYEGINAEKKTEKKIFKSHSIQENVPRISIKFDAALDSRTFKSATGLVGWDMRGNLLVIKTVIHRNVPSPFAAEAYACLEGMKLGIALGSQSIRIMGDSKTVIKKSKAMSTDKSVIGAIIKDIQSKKSFFQDLTLKHIHRSENTHAHGLAKRALAKEENIYLIGEELDRHISTLDEDWQRNPD